MEEQDQEDEEYSLDSFRSTEILNRSINAGRGLGLAARALYDSNLLLHRIVNAPPTDAACLEITSSYNNIQCLVNSIVEAIVISRHSGVGVVLLGDVRMGKYSKPLPKGSVIKSFKIPKFNTYTYSIHDDSLLYNGEYVHKSNFIAIVFKESESLQAISQVELLYDAIMALEGGYRDLATASSKSVGDILKIPNLARLGAGTEGYNAVNSRLTTLFNERQNHRMIALDTKEELIQSVSQSNTTSVLVSSLETRLSSLCGIPESILFGKIATGLTSPDTGQSLLYGRVVTNQVNIILSVLKYFDPLDNTIFSEYGVDANTVAIEESVLRKTNTEILASLKMSLSLSEADTSMVAFKLFKGLIEDIV